MPAFDILCLANSRKMQGRCVAGLRIDGQGWIRLVARTEFGELYPHHYKLNDGSDAQVLDLIRVEVISHQPEPHQPENWLIGRSSWKLLARPIQLKDYADLLRQHITQGPSLFGSVSDRADVAEFKQNPAPASLTLVSPRQVTLYITTNIKGNRQTRARFRLGEAQYDLVVTDPVWEHRLSDLQIGEYLTERNVMLTISLGEPFHSYCYKLVAAIIQQ